MIQALERIRILKGYSLLSYISGWPTHYANLGYQRASNVRDIYRPDDGIPDEAFLIKELKVNSLAGKNI